MYKEAMKLFELPLDVDDRDLKRLRNARFRMYHPDKCSKGLK